MKNPTSEWFQSLTQRERKILVVILFGVREEVRKQFAADYFRLFEQLVTALDNEYHGLKG